MRIEIVQELDAGDNKLEIPWPRPRRKPGHPRRARQPTGSTPSYVDLKKHPEKTAHLPECRNFPALTALLARINARGSRLQSAKCDVWTTTELAEDERLDFNLPFKTGSYVDVVFDRAKSRKSLAAHAGLAKRVQSHLGGFRVQGQMEIILRRCLFHPKEIWGYALTFFVHAYGWTRAEAKAEWSREIEVLGETLATPQ